jgi:hypothetical protein
MRRRNHIVVATLLVGLSLPAATHAHHSFAMFDFAKTDKASAVVEEFRWTNPHVVLVIKVDAKTADPADKPTLWSLELTSPGNLTRMGTWTRKAFKAGDRIEIEYHPLRDGRQGGAFAKATIVATGQVFESNLRSQEKPGLD